MISVGRALSVALCLGSCAVIASCGANDRDGAQALMEEVLLELRTTGSQTAFLPDSLTARSGAPVVLRLTNEGEVAHNLVVVLNDEAVEPIVLAAYQSIKTEYVPTGFEDDILASTPLVYPEESREVSFVMPAPGRYTFVCVFPSHGMTMRGTLISVP